MGEPRAEGRTRYTLLNDPNGAIEENLKQFLLNKQDKNYSSQTINLYLNAIKFFYREVLKIPEKINLKFAKRSKKLPIVLSREEIKNIINVIRHPKLKNIKSPL